LAQAAFGQSKVAKDFPAAEPGKNFDAIVQFYETPTGKHHKKVLDRGGRLKQELGVVKAGAYSLPAEALEALASDPDVVYISPDRRCGSFLRICRTQRLRRYGLEVPLEWARYRGVPDPRPLEERVAILGGNWNRSGVRRNSATCQV